MNGRRRLGRDKLCQPSLVQVVAGADVLRLGEDEDGEVVCLEVQLEVAAHRRVQAHVTEDGAAAASG